MYSLYIIFLALFNDTMASSGPKRDENICFSFKFILFLVMRFDYLITDWLRLPVTEKTHIVYYCQ